MNLSNTNAFFDNFNANFTRLYNAEKELKNVLGNVGKNIKVCPPLYVERGYNIFLQDDVHINISTKIIDDGGKVYFGKRVITGPYLEITTTDRKKNKGDVRIENDVWIGGGVKIGPGVTIGEGSVIAAGCRVESDIPPNVVAVGFPAKPIKEINKKDRSEELSWVKNELALPRMLRNEFFYTSAPDAVEMKKNAHKFYSKFNLKYKDINRAETELAKIFNDTGNNIKINTPFYYSYGPRISLGSNIVINKGAFLGDAGKIKIGDGTILDANVQLYTTNHLLNKNERIYIEPKDIILGKNVKLGKGVIVLSGVTIGDGVEIAEGSVVKDSIPSGAFASGIPAKIIVKS